MITWDYPGGRQSHLSLTEAKSMSKSPLELLQNPKTCTSHKTGLTSPKWWGGDSKLTSPLPNQYKPWGRAQCSLEDKAHCILLQRPWSFWTPTRKKPIPSPHEQREAAPGKQQSSHREALPPSLLKTTVRSQLRKMRGRHKTGGNLFSDQESLIWWKSQTWARLRSKEASCWSLREWAGLIAVTRSRKALRVISGHGRLKQN